MPSGYAPASMGDPSPHPAGESRALRWALTGATSAGDFASAVYGTILAASLLMAISGGPITILLGVVVTAVIFWLAHVHVAILRNVVRSGRHVTWADTRHALREEWPLAQASLSPVAPMLLAAVDILTVEQARWTGIAICVIGLIAWGIVISRVAGLGRRATALTIGINVALGLVLVVLKWLVH